MLKGDLCRLFSLLVHCNYLVRGHGGRVVRNGVFLAHKDAIKYDAEPTSNDGAAGTTDDVISLNPLALDFNDSSTYDGGVLSRQPRLVLLPKDEPRNSSVRLCTDGYCLDAGYDKLARPQSGETDGDGRPRPIRVGVSIDELRILDMEDSTFSISMQLYLGVRWIEPRISGPEKRKKREDDGEYYYYYDDYLSDFDDTTFVALDTKFMRHLWVPDVYVYNMKYGSRVLTDYDGRLFVLNENEIFYRQELIITVWCPLRFNFYPLDHQTCDFKLGSFTHKSNDMVFELDQLRYDWSRVNPLLEYVRINTLEDDDLLYSKHLANYSVTGFGIALKRRPFQYIANYYLPSSLFVVVSWASFLIPPDIIPGRMSLLITLFLVLISIFNTVNSKSPRVDGINSMAAYVIVCILFVFGALFAYTVILYKKKQKITRQAHLRNGSLAVAYLFPAEHLTRENKKGSKRNSATAEEDSVASSAASGETASVSANPASSEVPIPAAAAQSASNLEALVSTSPNPSAATSPRPSHGTPAVIPPPPPPPPPLGSAKDLTAVRKGSKAFANGFAKPSISQASARRPSIATLAGLIPAPKPKPQEPPPPGWHDKDMDIADKVFIVVFPLLFIVFNGLYWPFLINEGVLFA